MRRRLAARAVPCVALAVALLFARVAHPAAPAPFVAPSQWLSALGQQVIMPGYDRLAGSAAMLADRVGDLCSHPAKDELDAARTAWRQTAVELRRLSPLPFGPALETRILRRLDFWPTRPAQIESSLQARLAGTLPDARIGVTARGLPAIEYLLFDPGRRRLDADPAACTYAAWLAADAAYELAAIQPAWTTWIEGLNETEGEANTALLADGVNILIGGIDTLRLKYLEKAARSPGDMKHFDAWRSGAERAHLLAFFEGWRLGLQGREGLPGLTALMRGRGLLVLADHLDNHVERAAIALQALPERPGTDATALAHAISALAALQGVLAYDVSERLKVTVGFGDNDGD